MKVASRGNDRGSGKAKGKVKGKGKGKGKGISPAGRRALPEGSGNSLRHLYGSLCIPL